MNPSLKVVAIGGGSGLAALLRGLKHFPLSLSAVVTMTDNGASSGRLSRELGTLPPGDVRKCLAALSSDEALLTKLFEYRFHKGRGLSGHSLGNLLLLALSEISGSFEDAVQACSKILSIKGEVIPSTLEHVSLIAKLKNHQFALGEVDIPIMGHRFGIESIKTLPETVQANPKAVYFLANADLILIGPGSLYTSVLPNFLIPGIKEAVAKSKAAKVYVCNVSTERGETERFSVDDHLASLTNYISPTKLDAILVNSKVIESALEPNSAKLGSIDNITTDKLTIGGVRVIKADLIDEDQALYHDSRKLAETIWQLLISGKSQAVNPLVKRASS